MGRQRRPRAGALGAGFTGQGIVVASADTGVRWTHTRSRPHYRGWNGSSADHNYNWHDAIHSGGGVCGADHISPATTRPRHAHDRNDGRRRRGWNQIGVAPGAKWIGCRNMDQGNGTPATYTECFQWFIAPTDLTDRTPTRPSART